MLKQQPLRQTIKVRVLPLPIRHLFYKLTGRKMQQCLRPAQRRINGQHTLHGCIYLNVTNFKQSDQPIFSSIRCINQRQQIATPWPSDQLSFFIQNGNGITAVAVVITVPTAHIPAQIKSHHDFTDTDG